MPSANWRQSCLVALALLCAACAPAESAQSEEASTTDGSRGADGASSGESDPTGASGAAVRPAIEVLISDSLHLVAGKRVGLITNHTGIHPLAPDEEPTSTVAGVGVGSTIDRLNDHPDVELVALFGPEHGLRGDAEAGVRVASGVDGPTGLPVYSLYAETLRPPPESLDGLDVLMFDMQDVGARYYTYVSTMAYAMEAAGEAGLPFVVLDRPNPIGGALVQGNVLDPAFSTFVGLYPVPMRHGMTPGELALMYVGEFGIAVDLHVVPAEGWTRAMTFEQTGLPWIAPSPNMPSTESALHYPGTCLFEGTNLSVGRGTSRAFQWVGAPWLDGEALAAALQAYGLPGVRFESVSFTPEAPGDGKYGGEVVRGVRLVATDAAGYDPTIAAVAILTEARRQSGDRWEWRESHFDRLAGTDLLRQAVEQDLPLERIRPDWQQQAEAFVSRRAPYLIYP